MDRPHRAQGKIDAVIADVLNALDLGEGEEDPERRVRLQEFGPLVKADLADLIVLAPRVTEPDFELPRPPAEDPPESG
jgi:hypothetical protein